MGHKEKAIVRNLERQGFTVSRMRKHITMLSPDGVRITISGSIGRGRSLANTAAMVKRAGGSVGGRPKRGGRAGMV